MKKTIILLISLLVMVSFISCKSDGDKIVGVWRVADAMSKETYEQGDRAAETAKQADEMLKGAFKDATFEFRKDKTASFKTANESPLDFTWKMDGVNLELYKKDAKAGSPADILFWPTAEGKDASLFYMPGFDSSIVAKMVITETNTDCIVFLHKNG